MEDTDVIRINEAEKTQYDYIFGKKLLGLAKSWSHVFRVYGLMHEFRIWYSSQYDKRFVDQSLS